MKRISFLMVVSLLFLMSCASETEKPIITFDDATKGAYVKLVSETTRDIDLFNVGSWAYVYSVEFVDLEQGALVSEYRLDVTFRDNNPANGNSSGGPTTLRTYAASDFGTSAEGFKNIDNITISTSDLTSLFGLTNDELGPGDQFVVNGSVTTTDGAVYTAGNSTASVNGSAFAGHFDFSFAAVCPTDLEGTYPVTVLSTWCGNADAVGGRMVTMTLVAGTTSYDLDDFALSAYQPCYGESAGLPLGNLRMVDICNKITITGASQWSEVYTWHRLDINGTEMEVEWTNDYGEGGTSIIHHPTGWPPLSL